MNKSIHDRTKEIFRLVFQLCYNNICTLNHLCCIGAHCKPFTSNLRYSLSFLIHPYLVNMNHWTMQISYLVSYSKLFPFGLEFQLWGLADTWSFFFLTINSQKEMQLYQLIAVLTSKILKWDNYFKYSECSNVFWKLNHDIFQKKFHP
jgi:hypothetical protein